MVFMFTSLILYPTTMLKDLLVVKLLCVERFYPYIIV